MRDGKHMKVIVQKMHGSEGHRGINQSCAPIILWALHGVHVLS